MRLHVVAVPHTNTTKDYEYDCFTTDVSEFARCMTLRGHETTLYSGELNDVAVTEHVACVTLAQQEQWFGGRGLGGPAGFGYGSADTDFHHDSPEWAAFNEACITEVAKRFEPDDIVCTTVGQAHRTLVDFCNTVRLRCVEFIVGFPADARYTRYANYPTYAHRHYTDGWHRRWPQFYDNVTPNIVAQPLEIANEDRADYLLFIGRKVDGKGLGIAAEVARRTGMDLVVVGQGPTDDAPDAHHLGIVLGEAKNRLICDARAVIMPSLYEEPFGRVHAEALVRGVPVISPDWAVFSETIINGVNGWRCKSVAEFCDAVEYDEYDSPEEIAAQAIDRYCYDPTTGAGRVGQSYDDWFERLLTDPFPQTFAPWVEVP
jgi:glycosyltransferase involved in cell wall biosynthesis